MDPEERKESRARAPITRTFKPIDLGSRVPPVLPLAGRLVLIGIL